MAEVKIIDKTDGLTNVCGPRIYYQFFNSGKTVTNLVDFIKGQKSTRTFDLYQIKKALQDFDVSSVFVKNKDFKLCFLAKHVAGSNYVLVEVSYKKSKNTFTIESIKYNDDILSDIFLAYAFD